MKYILLTELHSTEEFIVNLNSIERIHQQCEDVISVFLTSGFTFKVSGDALEFSIMLEEYAKREEDV